MWIKDDPDIKTPLLRKLETLGLGPFLFKWPSIHNFFLYVFKDTKQKIMLI